jgi:hypothetical protein
MSQDNDNTNPKVNGENEKTNVADPAGPPFTIGVTDRDGNELPANDPGAKEAHGIVFDVHITGSTQPSATEMELYRDLAKVEHALQEIYLRTAATDEAATEARFRPHFVRLFFLAQLALEGDVTGSGTERKVGGRLSPEAAKAEIAALAADVIDDEAPSIKNTHLRQLAAWAGALALPFLAGYAVLMMWGQKTEGAKWLVDKLTQLHIEAVPAANFMLLWVGCFVGVCLSYAIRTHSFSLTDLTRTDADYLIAPARLLLTGTFVMLLALLGVVGLGDVEIGTLKLSAIAGNATLAFVVGAVLGISEQKLTGTVEKRVGNLFGGASK